ncbi:hypothetical protein CsSME_00000102 [Camellia sinensis var. sinensis]
MNLPEDVLFEILLRLPVKSLLRFKAVCKSFYIVITNFAFISKHLNNKGIPRLLVCHRDNHSNKRLVSLFTNDNLAEPMSLDVPPFFNNNFGHVRLIGPCNGIVCLYGFPDNIALWNPATRDFKSLPVSQISRPHDAKVLGGDLAFGFDSKANDYKVVQILFCSSKQLGVAYQVEVYNLSTNSWRKYHAIVPANIMFLNIWSMLYKSETFCWWAKDGNIEVILSFDMSNEKFHKIPLPFDIGDLGGEHKVIRSIVPMNESIALIVYRTKQVEKFFDLWVLNEFGVDESWTKLSTIGPLSRVERPLGFWKNDEFVLENSCGMLVMFNSHTRKIKNLGLQGKRDRLEVLIYKESLVSLNNGS